MKMKNGHAHWWETKPYRVWIEKWEHYVSKSSYRYLAKLSPRSALVSC